MRFISGWSDRPYLRDGLFALAVGVFVAGTSGPAGSGQTGVRQLDTLGLLLIAVAAAGLVVRRSRPALCLLLTLGSTLTFLALHFPYGPVFLFTAIAMYSVAAWQSTRYAAVATVLAVLVHLPWALLVEQDPEGPLMSLLTSVAWLTAPVGLGIAVRARREARARSAVEDRRRHAYEERLRIAQEVHDVVGHALAVISMNAGAALHVLAKDPASIPEHVDKALRAIRQVSNGALDELRVTLATFAGAGDGDGDGAQAGPQTGATAAAERRLPPGLAVVPQLVAATQVDGLAVTLTVRGVPGDAVPAAVDLAGYRIVQEALANVVRHAGASRAEVVVEYQPQRVTLTVTDDGRHGGPANPSGTGLDSMRERARALGGTLTAGRAAGPPLHNGSQHNGSQHSGSQHNGSPHNGAGWAVTAVLPYSAHPVHSP